MTEDEDRVRAVYWEPIRCPYCGSTERRDVNRKSGRTVSYHRCLTCERRYIARMRPPPTQVSSRWP